jgi:hypothetical protein
MKTNEVYPTKTCEKRRRKRRRIVLTNETFDSLCGRV